MRQAILVIFALLALTYVRRDETPQRTWTDSTGRYTVDAELIEIEGDTVILETIAGKQIHVPIDKLSPVDRAFLGRLSQIITGEVVEVLDGDTVIILDATKTQHKIRLEGIDAPESGQTYGPQAKKALSDLVDQKTVRVEWKETDRYGRLLGHLYVGGTWVNLELIASGAAWHYKKYNEDERLAEAEIEAKARRDGLWGGSTFIAPWDYRKGVRKSATVEAPKPIATRQPAVTPWPDMSPSVNVRTSGIGGATVYINKSGSKYHRAGCRYLTNKSIPVSRRTAVGRYGACTVCKP